MTSWFLILDPTEENCHFQRLHTGISNLHPAGAVTNVYNSVCERATPAREIILQEPYTQRKGLRVSFSPFWRTIEPEGRCYTSPVALEEENDFWKAGAMDGEPLYIMNFQTI